MSKRNGVAECKSKSKSTFSSAPRRLSALACTWMIYQQGSQDWLDCCSSERSRNSAITFETFPFAASASLFPAAPFLPLPAESVSVGVEEMPSRTWLPFRLTVTGDKGNKRTYNKEGKKRFEKALQESSSDRQTGVKGRGRPQMGSWFFLSRPCTWPL